MTDEAFHPTCLGGEGNITVHQQIEDSYDYREGGGKGHSGHVSIFLSTNEPGKGGGLQMEMIGPDLLITTGWWGSLVERVGNLELCYSTARDDGDYQRGWSTRSRPWAIGWSTRSRPWAITI
ncbi:hypothetical protein Bbelb_184200 [Branchiostoma belcheri]|nr:hypothetical protein Bbelb_184200 [Branchiostoma belcheri]